MSAELSFAKIKTASDLCQSLADLICDYYSEMVAEERAKFKSLWEEMEPQDPEEAGVRAMALYIIENWTDDE